MTLQNVPLQHIDYFELKATEKQQMQEGLSTLKTFLKSKMLSQYQEEKKFLPLEIGVTAEMSLHEQTLLK